MTSSSWFNPLMSVNIRPEVFMGLDFIKIQNNRKWNFLDEANKICFDKTTEIQKNPKNLRFFVQREKFLHVSREKESKVEIYWDLLWLEWLECPQGNKIVLCRLAD